MLTPRRTATGYFHTDYKKTVEALTTDSVRDFLNNMLLKSGNHIEVIMLPEAK